jgi:hypothetical protein
MALRPTSLGSSTRSVLAVLAAATLTILASGSAATTASASTAAPAEELQRNASLRLQMLNVPDRLSRMNAFRMLIPRGWRLRGGVVWDLRYANPASAIMQVHAPRGPEALELYPLYPHMWDTQGIFGFPEGSLYLGHFVQRPMNATAYLERAVIPAFRGRLGPRVVQRQRLPNVARMYTQRAKKLGTGLRTTYDAARVRIAYRQGGQSIEEDFYALVNYISQAPFLPTRVTWAAESLFSFRAARGRLNRSQGLLQAMNASIRLNLRWYAGYLHVQKAWIDGQIQAIRAAGALSRAIARANDEITDSIRSSYRTQQESSDRISEAFSERIRGVETYRNPFESRDVQLPSDYSQVWASARGEYAFSNDAGFNPNVGSTIEWRLLRTT